MNSILHKSICLQLNRVWQPVNTKTVKKALEDLCAGTSCKALDIDYEIDGDGNPIFDTATFNPVTWEEWVELPVRSWELGVHTSKKVIRAPTVLVSLNYAKMPVKEFKGKPTTDAIWLRDSGIDQYTGERLKRDDATVDHVLAKDLGGKDVWENMVLTHRDINTKKANKTLKESGLRLIRMPRAPKPVPHAVLIRRAAHMNWKHFLVARD